MVSRKLAHILKYRYPTSFRDSRRRNGGGCGAAEQGASPGFHIHGDLTHEGVPYGPQFHLFLSIVVLTGDGVRYQSRLQRSKSISSSLTDSVQIVSDQEGFPAGA